MDPKAPGCLGWLLQLFTPGADQRTSRRGGMDEANPYRVRDDFLSPAEASFFHVVRQTVGDRYVAVTKVSLGDLFYVARPNVNKSARGRIAQKHVDFLLLDPGTLRPVLALELDDSSHRSAEQGEKDAFKDAVFKSAGLPLLRVPVRAAYDVHDLSASISQALRPSPTAPPSMPSEQVVGSCDVPPLCRKCGREMVRRTAKRGARVGNEFWGCPSYPRCSDILP